MLGTECGLSHRTFMLFPPRDYSKPHMQWGKQSPPAVTKGCLGPVLGIFPGSHWAPSPYYSDEEGEQVPGQQPVPAECLHTAKHLPGSLGRQF